MKKIISSAALVAISAMLTLTSVGVEAGPKGCKAQKLKHKLPEERSSIDPGGSFSAQASHRMQIDTLKFSIKGTPLDINITTKGNGVHAIEGTIPDDISAGFARIKITGKDSRGCKLSDGWLLEVTGEAAPAAKEEAPAQEEAEAVEEAPVATEEETGSTEAPSEESEAAASEE